MSPPLFSLKALGSFTILIIFIELCDIMFDMEKVPHEDLHPDFTYKETRAYVLRKKMTNKEGS